ncbi:MotE family protein [Sporolactobacillus sp. KGMB 08714]|uniref:MotE family protein n=1 Tax=Sporolactobacillus sp. KGMB 08714 TaxID=3064704 RepID=UPI002FBE3838
MEEKKSGFGSRLLKILLAVLVPIVFLLLLVGLLLKLAGLNPIVEVKGLLFGNNAAQTFGGTSSNQITTLKQQIAAQQSTIKQLQSDNTSKSDQISQLNTQLQQAQAAASQKSSASASQAQTARDAVYAQTYRNMDPAKAAAIFEKLPTKQAAEYINMLDDKTKASILQNMPADKAAALTPLLQAQPAAASTSGTGSSSVSTSASSGTYP